MLKFSANLSVLFTEAPLIERFELAKKQGFEAVEIQFPYELPPEIIRQCLDQHHLKLVLFNVGADDLLCGGEGLASVPEKQGEFKTAVTQALEYAKILKPNCINILAGRCQDQSKKQLYLQTFLKNLAYALTQLSPLGITTVFEAINTFDMPDFLIHSTEQMYQVQQKINHPDLKMQYDIYHMHRMGESCASDLKKYTDKIGHIQFADAPHRSQPSTGEIDFKKLFSVIKQSNYEGWTGAEYNPIGETRNSFFWKTLT
ncbi:MAG: TIM barrel protein [Methylococcales bacterium]|nr:TIM barrel protein [Methylococcales bacterium]